MDEIIFLLNTAQLHLDARAGNIIPNILQYSVVLDPAVIPLSMSNPGYFTKEGLTGKETDSNNCQPDPQDGAKRARMDDSQAGTNQAGSSQASASTSQSNYATTPAESSSLDSSSTDGLPSDAFSSSSSDNNMEVDQAIVTIQWYTPVSYTHLTLPTTPYV